MSAFNASLFNNALFGGGATVPFVSTTCKDVLYIAFREARVLKRPQGAISQSESLDGMIFLNQQLDYWSARGCYSWTTTFQEFTLTPNHQPTLIGPGLTSPDFAAAQRPVSIVSANVVLPGNPTTDIQMMIRDNAWWAAKSTKNHDEHFPDGPLLRAVRSLWAIVVLADSDHGIRRAPRGPCDAPAVHRAHRLPSLRRLHTSPRSLSRSRRSSSTCGARRCL